MNRYAMPRLLLQILQQIDDLRLHRNIQRAHRFIAHDQFGSTASARAMPMRWRCPPLKIHADTVAHSIASKPTAFNNSAIRFCRAELLSASS